MSIEQKMSREFVKLPSFLSKWEEIGLNDDDMRDLENKLLENPKIGPVMPGTGKVRKMRFAFKNRSKSRSARVIYVDFEVYEKIYLVDVYAKADQESLSRAERNELKELVEILEFELHKK